MVRKAKKKSSRHTAPSRRDSTGARKGMSSHGRQRAGATEGDESEDRRRRSEAPTIPPPPVSGAHATEVMHSALRPKKLPSISAAAVDEVTADLTKDPRRER
jgi:hypothetical protein